MKFLVLILTILLNSMSCMQQKGLTKNATDRQKIIYDVIHRSITQQDMPAFEDLKGRKTIYLHNCYVNFIHPSPTDDRPLMDKNDVPKKVEGLSVSLISVEELQTLANKTKMYEFMLTIGNIKIEGDSATIAIDGWYRGPKENKGFKMSGGGGIMHYSKENEIWVFKRFSQMWIS